MSREFDEYVVRTYAEGCAALDTMGHALRYISEQYSGTMTRPVAQAHFDARALLINRATALLDEMELELVYGSEETPCPEK